MENNLYNDHFSNDDCIITIISQQYSPQSLYYQLRKDFDINNLDFLFETSKPVLKNKKTKKHSNKSKKKSKKNRKRKKSHKK